MPVKVKPTTVVRWRSRYTEGGTWYWFFDVGEGWMACIVDDSQEAEPKRATSYRIFALSGARELRPHETEESFKTLTEAKSEAIAFALGVASGKIKF